MYEASFMSCVAWSVIMLVIGVIIGVFCSPAGTLLLKKPKPLVPSSSRYMRAVEAKQVNGITAGKEYMVWPLARYPELVCYINDMGEGDHTYASVFEEIH